MLTKRELSLARIGSYTAISDASNLTEAVSNSLDSGATLNELKETFIQLIAYCGFPRGLKGISICLEVLNQRKNKGITDIEGRSPSLITDTRSRYDRGEEVQILVSGWSKEELRSGMLGFYPKVDTILKEYVFADIYDSDVLSYAEREIVTLSAQMAMDGIDSMVQAHLNAAMNIGLNKEDVYQLIDLIEIEFNKERADKYRAMFGNVISIRNEK